jgi:NADH-quinone oxidoreductase subunit N
VIAPTFEWFELAPVLVVLAGACLGVVLEAVLPQSRRFGVQLILTIGTLLIAMGFLAWNFKSGSAGLLAMRAVSLDGVTYLVWASLLVFGLLSLMVFGERKLTNGVSAFAASAASVPGSPAEAEAVAAHHEHTEVFPLALFSLAGMMVFAAANDLITAFIALEVMSLPLYLLAGMARRRRLLSQEAALKYFLLGSLASAFFLFGMALIYGYSGSFEYAGIDLGIANPIYGRGLLLTGSVLMAVGLLFKIGAVPFHNWVPDVYVGAPTPVTGFMAICVKLAAVAATVRFFYVALGAERWSWQPVMAAVAALTMVVGVLLALTQTDIKRLLAYSSVSHAGFVLVAVTGASVANTADSRYSIAAIVFYLLAYGFATVASFAVVTMVRNSAGEASDLTSWAGLGRKNPLLAGAFAVLMLSFAGIPLTGGFIGKWEVFTAAWQGGYSWLVVVAIVASLIAAYVYLKVIVAMFFSEEAEGVVVGNASLLTLVPIATGALASIYLGLFPGPVIDLVTAFSVFFR